MSLNYLRSAPGESFGFSAYADLYDGRNAGRKRVSLKEAQGGTPALLMEVPEGESHVWPFDSLRMVPEQASDDMLIVTSTERPLARLMVRDQGALELIITNSPYLSRRPPVRGKGRVLAWAGAAIASVLLIIFVLVPVAADQLARFLPPEGEKALGDTTLEQIRSALDDTGFEPLAVCDSPDGLDALDAMQDRLAGDLELPYPLTVTVLDHDLINAFALPGGHVVFFRGLIDAAETPEEVTAVFAHEIGHVVARDPTRIALRSAGSIGVLGLLLGDFAGGAVVLFLAERLIQADYTQEAEAGADAFAHDMLADADVSPEALGTMFERLRAEYGDQDNIVAHFLSHPSLGDRIAESEAAAERLGVTGRPILDDEGWAALQAICR